MKVYRILHPMALTDPRLRAFLAEATTETWVEGEGGPDLIAAVAQIVADPVKGALYVVAHGAEYIGAALVLLPTTPLSPYPTVSVFYVRPGARKGAKKALLLALVDFLRQNHYTKAHLMTGPGARDSAWKKALKRVGKAQKRASVLEVQLA